MSDDFDFMSDLMVITRIYRLYRTLWNLKVRLKSFLLFNNRRSQCNLSSKNLIFTAKILMSGSNLATFGARMNSEKSNHLTFKFQNFNFRFTSGPEISRNGISRPGISKMLNSKMIFFQTIYFIRILNEAKNSAVNRRVWK